MVRFAQYRDWLASDEYKAQIAALVARPDSPPRQDWPEDIRPLIEMHREVGTVLLHGAVNRFRKADALEALLISRTC